ncbi:MAG: hypothetical protein WBQ25_11765 [Nitrososphaeraceae archaeon]
MMKSIGAVIVGIGLVAVSLYFVYPYADFTPTVPHAHVTTGPVSIAGIDPLDAIRLFIFAVIFAGGIGLLAKGFI